MTVAFILVIVYDSCIQCTGFAHNAGFEYRDAADRNNEMFVPFLTFPHNDMPEEPQFPEHYNGPSQAPGPEMSPVHPPAPSNAALSRKPVVQDLASRGSRLAARLIDSAAVGIPWFLAVVSGDSPLATVMAILVLAVSIYQLMLLSREGQTIGKSTLGIRIVKVNTGAPGGFVPNVLLREFVNTILSFIPLYSLVDVLFIFREDQRCIHDHIAGTKVVND